MEDLSTIQTKLAGMEDDLALMRRVLKDGKARTPVLDRIYDVISLLLLFIISLVVIQVVDYARQIASSSIEVQKNTKLILENIPFIEPEK